MCAGILGNEHLTLPHHAGTNPLIGLSMVAFKNPGEFENFFLQNRTPTDIPGIEVPGTVSPVFYELSYKMDEEFLQNFFRLQARAVSVHAPCPYRETLPNLGSRNPAVLSESYDLLEESADTAAAFSADVLVLHVGYATDRRIFTSFENRKKSLEDAPPVDPAWIYRRKGMISNSAYCRSSEYRLHTAEVIRNLPRAIEICRKRGVTLAVENLNPRISYLMQLPEDLVLTAEQIPEIRFCLDIGHLWISSIVHGFDFLRGIQKILNTHRVATTHLHGNLSVLDDPESLSDDHLSLGRGEIPMMRAISMLLKNGISRFILEVKEQPIENLRALERFLQSSL